MLAEAVKTECYLGLRVPGSGMILSYLMKSSELQSSCGFIFSLHLEQLIKCDALMSFLSLNNLLLLDDSYQGGGAGPFFRKHHVNSISLAFLYSFFQRR